jgi:hypothetical protein
MGLSSSGFLPGRFLLRPLLPLRLLSGDPLLPLFGRLQSGLLVSGFFLATYPLEPFGFAFGPLARSLSFRFFLALGL